jgi:NAD(P)-dependent dehydrogenase (short-subunit alcohol dehydrogenase family)
MSASLPPLPLSGRAALVTGAAIRVGRAIALELARAGADVAVHYRSSKQEAESAAEEIRALGRRSVAIPAELASPEDCRRVVRDAVAAFGSLDFLVHSASNFRRAPLAETTEAVWDSAMNVNARAGLLMAREAAPVLRQRRGRIVLVSDLLARDPEKNYLAHAVSKSAVEGLTRALAVELAPEVLVNAVAPGTVLVPDGTSAEVAEKLARRVPLRRNGTPEDVAKAVVFLCAGPDFITGQVLAVDGGQTVT